MSRGSERAWSANHWARSRRRGDLSESILDVLSSKNLLHVSFFFFFQAEDGIRDLIVTGVQTCALPIFPAETRVMDYEGAVAGGAIALFGEKYDKDVRVLRLGEFSMELCGGTHVQRAGDIGLFKIVSEGGVASGVRRIEALTGEAALEYVDQNEALLRDLTALVRGTREELPDKVREQLERARQMEREVRALKDRLASGQGVDLAAGAVDVQGVKVIATRVDGADAGALRSAVDQLKERLKSAVVVLASVENPAKVLLVVGVTADQTARIKAGELAGAVAAQVGGRGGGRADFAQAGGSKPEALDAALESVQAFVRARLAA